MPNFRRHLSCAFFFFFFFCQTPAGKKCICKVERLTNRGDTDGTARYELSHLDPCCLQKPVIIACSSERVKTSRDTAFPTILHMDPNQLALRRLTRVFTVRLKFRPEDALYAWLPQRAL